MDNKQQDALESTYNLLMEQRPLVATKGCPRCGCEGLHACTGSPIVWTDEDRARLKETLGDMFGWKKSVAPAP